MHVVDMALDLAKDALELFSDLECFTDPRCEECPQCLRWAALVLIRQAQGERLLEKM